MSGLKTNTKDLGKCATRFFSATQAQETRKNAAIEELARKYISKGLSPDRAMAAAREEYFNNKLK